MARYSTKTYAKKSKKKKLTPLHGPVRWKNKISAWHKRDDDKHLTWEPGLSEEEPQSAKPKGKAKAKAKPKAKPKGKAEPKAAKINRDNAIEDIKEQIKAVKELGLQLDPVVNIK